MFVISPLSQSGYTLPIRHSARVVSHTSVPRPPRASVRVTPCAAAAAAMSGGARRGRMRPPLSWRRL